MALKDQMVSFYQEWTDSEKARNRNRYSDNNREKANEMVWSRKPNGQQEMGQTHNDGKFLKVQDQEEDKEQHGTITSKQILVRIQK